MKFTYDKSLTGLVLDSFGKAVDKDNQIVERKDKSQKVLTIDGNPIQKKDFGGIKNGSLLFVSKDVTSLISLSKYLAKKQ